MTQIHEWYGEWRDTQIACPKCEWQGVLEESALEAYKELADFCCPRCNKTLAIINFPTRDDVQQNWGKLTAEEKSLYADTFSHQDEFDRAHLASPAQLPDIAADSIILVWDFEERSGANGDHEKPYVVIKHDGKSIWEELAFFECVARFDEVVTILQQKYGTRLKDLIPSGASETYLGGDDLSASDKVHKIRARMAPGEITPLARRDALALVGDQDALNEIRFEREYEAHHLQSATQLPSLKGGRFLLTWDVAEDPPRAEVRRVQYGIQIDWSDESGDGFLYLTIRSRGKLVWREATSDGCWRGDDGELRFAFVERYIEIAQILKSKYGTRLMALVPTERSQAYIGGLPWEGLSRAQARHFPQTPA